MLINLLSAITSQARILSSSIIMCFIGALSIAIVVVVLLQRGSENGSSAITGANTESFFSKNKANRKDTLLRILTIVFACLIAVLAIIFFILAPTAAA